MHRLHLCHIGTLLYVFKTISIFTLTQGKAQETHCICFNLFLACTNGIQSLLYSNLCFALMGY